MTENLQNIKNEQSRIDFLKIQIDHEKAEVERVSGLYLLEKHLHSKTKQSCAILTLFAIAFFIFILAMFKYYSDLKEENNSLRAIPEQLKKKLSAEPTSVKSSFTVSGYPTVTCTRSIMITNSSHISTN